MEKQCTAAIAFTSFEFLNVSMTSFLHASFGFNTLALSIATNTNPVIKIGSNTPID
jgi:hypothetical protein